MFPRTLSARRPAAVLAAITLASGALLAPSAASAHPSTSASGVDAAEVGAQGVTNGIRGAGGGVYFYDYGDVLRVSDYRADGYGVSGHATANGKKTSLHVTTGKDTGKEVSLNLPEGTVVWIQMCYTDNGKNVKCSGTVRAVA